MGVSVGVPAERQDGEKRVAIIPDVVRRLGRKGVNVVVERGAGERAGYLDSEYTDAGATLGDQAAAYAQPIVARVSPPDDAEIGMLKKGSVLIGFMRPLDDPALAGRLAASGVTALAMELVPRISRAQKMDALSAMGAVGGYKAALIAADTLPRFFPLLTTAAGTVRPANALILGAGVAGLQAIATARRLGARVSAYDIRDAVREEVQSLGAKFVELPLEIDDMQDSGGYARALVEEKAKRQTDLLVPFIAESDVVISTALIPGRPAPRLVTKEAVERMAPGSVIVDLAAANGGNCELTEPGETVVRHGVTILGPLNLPSDLAFHASQMYARTVQAMIEEIVGEEGLVVDLDDDVIGGSCLTHGGNIVNERVRSLLP